MAMRKDIVNSEDMLETRERIWAMMHKGLSKNEIYKELEPEYLVKYDLASIISKTLYPEELPAYKKENKILFFLLCTISVIRFFTAIIFLIYCTVLDIETENKRFVNFIFIPFIFFVPLISIWLAREVKRMNNDIYIATLLLPIFGVQLIFKEYSNTTLGWLLGSVQIIILVSTIILSFNMLRKYSFNKRHLRKMRMVILYLIKNLIQLVLSKKIRENP